MRPIEEYEFPRLHPQLYDRRLELKKLIQSVAVAFLDLLEILAKSPNSPQRGQRIDDLGLLVGNLACFFQNCKKIIEKQFPNNCHNKRLKLTKNFRKKNSKKLSQKAPQNDHKIPKNCHKKRLKLTRKFPKKIPKNCHKIPKIPFWNVSQKLSQKSA